MKTVEKEIIKSLSENVKTVSMISKEIKYSGDYIRKVLRRMKLDGLVKMYGKKDRRSYWYLSKKGKDILK